MDNYSKSSLASGVKIEESKSQVYSPNIRNYKLLKYVARITDNFQFLKELGRGKFGTVLLAKRISTQT